MAEWTAADMPPRGGTVAVVTGANSGLGLVTTRELARAGAHVVMACRDLSRAEAAAEEIREAVSDAKLEVARLDLAELSSVHEFALGFAKRHEGLDLLINNAGVMALPRRLTPDGLEMHIGINHFGHFALTGLLLEGLLARPFPRVVTVSSPAHRMGRMAFDDLHGERRYWRWSAYGQSKLANLLFAFELQRRSKTAGLPLKSVAAHPGYAATNLQSGAIRVDRGPLTMVEGWIMALGNRLLAQSQEMGALPILYAATVADLPGGSYVGPEGLLEQRGHPQLVGSSHAAQDPEAAGRLWDISEQLTDVHYDFGRA